MKLYSVCIYQFVIEFPAALNHSNSTSMTGTSSLNFSLDFFNFWTYNLLIFIGCWWIAARSPAQELWSALEQLLLNVPLSGKDIKRCRKTAILCTIGTLFMVFLF